ncbi:DUF1501 domain-containing protein [Variovorax sp. PCZ-1]|uniref:DUF1501 domain-containing protein n=1 Tax=Variovorax sp. PCZ-1 TaxID=2835533 RepID=UPI001BD0B313|nr:DUF1501 domain-containing protein [Variovorax sp. PCZ-1]MBS7807890.1 DUF1501 domain-containing protein [Variovorax sp. PCZ-1]
MKKSYTSDPSRRHFLKAATQFSAMGAAAPIALNLAGIQAAAAQTADDYRALVCVFLFGGNDQTSTLVPFDSAEFSAMASARGSIARPAADFISLGNVASQSNRSFALAKELSPLADLYKQNRLSILANVGPMYTPLTKANFEASAPGVPPQLFSHNDQQSVWQSSGVEGSTVGWGGRFGDLLASRNGSNSVFTSISANGTAVFLYGNTVQQFQIDSGGPATVTSLDRLYGSTDAGAALREIITANPSPLFESHLGEVTRRSLKANQTLKDVLAAAAPLTTVFNESNSLAKQLRMVARLIAVRKSLGMGRQVFFVGMGGFDHHNSLVQELPGLHTKVAEAMASFYAATAELKVENLVTTFTASEFGRTLTSNGDGSDHGWGGHQFIMGGAVKGGTIVGSYPTVALGTAEDLGRGRLLPTTSTSQLAATLATWFGVPAGSLVDALPYINNFDTKNLGLFI